MSSVVPLMAISSAAVVVLIVVFVILMRKGSDGQGGRKPRNSDQAVQIRDAKRRLAQDPRDAKAHEIVADAYYTNRDFANAYKHYRTLIDLCATNDLDEFQITLRHALCAMNLKNHEEAYKGLMIARTMDDTSFEVNYNLGIIEFERRNYPRAVQLLAAANALEPAHPQTYRYLGLSLFSAKRYKQASTALRTWLDATPDDKEALIALGQCYYHLKRHDPATRIFQHLRADPKHGPHACLYSGTIYLNLKQYESAIADFEIGLKHDGVKKELMLELRYRLAAAMLKDDRMDAAIAEWRRILEDDAGFKDTKELVSRYAELSANKHLHTYLMGSVNEFVNLCRKIVQIYLDRATVRIMDVSLHQNDHVDILTEVSTRKWEDVILHRFLRNTGTMGDLVLRDFNARLKEVHAGRGVCHTAGEFNEGARAFVEARLIDLIEKKELLKLFGRLAKAPQITA